VQELTVQDIFGRDREAACHALLLDPITSEAVSLRQGRELFNEMWKAEGDLLAWYE